VSLWFLGVVPFLRGRPTLYDVMEDKVRIIFKDGSNLSVHFSEIDTLRLFDPAVYSSRPLVYKLIDPFSRIVDYSRLSFRVWWEDVALNILPPYSFGFGSRQAEIHIRLKTGYRAMRILVPWFNSPLRSRDLGLMPFDPGEFLGQLRGAFAKWKDLKRKRAA
jgi:hypothetical protein